MITGPSSETSRCPQCGATRPGCDTHVRKGPAVGWCIDCTEIWREVTTEMKRLKLVTYRAVEQSAVFGRYGRRCTCCGSANRLGIDHVNGDSQQHHVVMGGRQKLYRWLIANEFPPGFQTLCSACNSSKRSSDRCRLDHSTVPATSRYGRWRRPSTIVSEKTEVKPVITQDLTTECAECGARR